VESPLKVSLSYITIDYKKCQMLSLWLVKSNGGIHQLNSGCIQLLGKFRVEVGVGNVEEA